MAVQLPGAGTPIDATLLGSYAQEINRLAGTIANSTKRSTVIPPPSDAGSEARDVITSELSFFATHIDISSPDNKPGDRTVRIPFTNSFAQVPIVVGTPYTNAPSFNPNGIETILTTVTPSACSFKVQYNGGSRFSGYLNIIAIGVSTKL